MVNQSNIFQIKRKLSLQYILDDLLLARGTVRLRELWTTKYKKPVCPFMSGNLTHITQTPHSNHRHKGTKRVQMTGMMLRFFDSLLNTCVCDLFSVYYLLDCPSCYSQHASNLPMLFSCPIVSDVFLQLPCVIASRCALLS